MSEAHRLWPLLRQQLIPTRLQILISGVLSVLIILIAQSEAILKRLGLADVAYVSAGKQLQGRIGVVLGSQLASNVVLVTFWATVGLVTYLVVWSVLNIIIDVRNEVTLETTYANRGHWRGVWETIALKSVILAALVAFMATFRYTFSLLIALTSSIQGGSLTSSILQSAAAWVGLSIEIYLIMLIIILLITPWYRVMPFTDPLI